MRWIVAVAMLGVGCTSVWQARPMAALPVCACERVPPTRARIAIAPFVDGRSGEFGRVRRSPVYARTRIAYPENAGAFVDRDRVVAVGSLDTALPLLLAREMEQMELVPSVALGAAPADWIVSGRLLRAEVDSAHSRVVAAALGLFGVPFGVERTRLEYEIWVAPASEPSRPMLHRTYSFAGRAVVGLYYGQHAAYDLLLRGLETTLPEVVRDVSRLVQANG